MRLAKKCHYWLLLKPYLVRGGLASFGISSCFSFVNNSSVAMDPLVVVPLELKEKFRETMGFCERFR